MWQAQLAPHAVIGSTGYGVCPEHGHEEGGGILDGLDFGAFHYLPANIALPDLWISEDGSAVLHTTVGDEAPAQLAYEDWKPAPQKALEGLIAGTSCGKMVEAGFSPKLFEVLEEGNPVAGEGFSVADVLTLPLGGAPAEFNYLMERTPEAAECWYYASPEMLASC